MTVRSHASGAEIVAVGGHFSRDVFPAALSSWLFSICLLLVPFNDLALAPHVSAGDGLFMLAVLVAFFERLRTREVIPVLPVYWFGAAALFLCWIVNDALAPDDQFGSFLVILVMVMLLPQAMVQLRIRDERELRFMILCWTTGGVLGATFAVAFCYGLIPDHHDWYWATGRRARGLTPHPNRLGLNCLLTMPGLLLLIASSRRWSLRIAAIIGIGIVLKAIDFSGSRATLVAALLMVLVWALLYFREALQRDPSLRAQAGPMVLLAFALIAVLALYSVAAGSVPFLQGVIDRFSGGDTQSDTGRAWLNERAWEAFLDNMLFGEGYRRFGVFEWKVAHNLYLQYLSAAGLVGLMVLLIALLYPLRYPLRAYLNGSAGPYRHINIALIAAAFSLLAWLWKQSGFTAIEGWLVMGLLAYVTTWRLYDRGPTTERRRT